MISVFFVPIRTRGDGLPFLDETGLFGTKSVRGDGLPSHNFQVLKTVFFVTIRMKGDGLPFPNWICYLGLTEINLPDFLL